MDRLINRRRNRRPAGATLATNDSLPMKDSSSRIEALRRLSQDCTSCRISASFSCGRESGRASESRRIPRNVIWVMSFQFYRNRRQQEPLSVGLGGLASSGAGTLYGRVARSEGVDLGTKGLVGGTPNDAVNWIW